MERPAALDLHGVRVLLCDADGNLFASEEPAFEASADVTNRYLESLGVARRFSAGELRLTTTGKSFRTTAVDLALAAGIAEDDARRGLETWVDEERRRVTRHLGATLAPDARVSEPLRRLAERYRLAAVSSSAAGRLAACFTATGLADLFPPELCFSAEDSLAVPTSKPDPAIYRLAGESLGISPREGLAVEDAAPGVRSAVGAGFQTIGNVAFVPPAEREQRRGELRAAGAAAVVESWAELERLLDRRVLAELL